MDWLHRIAIGAPISPGELRIAGVFVLLWFALDLVWFLATLNHWWGL